MGLEPTTYCLEGSRSSQLSYSRKTVSLYHGHAQRVNAPGAIDSPPSGEGVRVLNMA